MHTLIRRAAVAAGAMAVVLGTGVGVASASGAPVLAFSPASHDYQQVPVGQTPAPTQVFTLKNTGGSATSVLKITLPPGPFSITANTCTGTSLGPGKSCTVTVQFAPTATGGASATLTAMSNKPAAMASAALSGTGIPAGHLFWTNLADPNVDLDSGSIVMANLDGTNPTTLVTGQNSPAGVAVDGSNIYWTTSSGFGGTNSTDGTINECPRTNCNNGTVTQLVSGQNSPQGVAVDGSGNLYWANAGDGTVNECSVANCSGTVTQLATGQGQPGGVAVDGSGNLYWTNFLGTGAINECSVANCSGTVTQLVTGQDFPWGLTVDGSNIYWANAPGNGGTLEQCPRTNCSNSTTTQLAGGFFQTGGAAVNGGTLFFAHFGLGTLDECSLANCSGTVTSLASSGAFGPWGVAVSPN
jgi:hypothetical protein